MEQVWIVWKSYQEKVSSAKQENGSMASILFTVASEKNLTMLVEQWLLRFMIDSTIIFLQKHNLDLAQSHSGSAEV